MFWHYYEASLAHSWARLTKGLAQCEPFFNYTWSPRSSDFCIDGLIECDSDVCMIRPNFLTTADRLELWSCVKRQREDHGVARRANALLLLDDGMSCSQIAKVLFLDDDTVRS